MTVNDDNYDPNYEAEGFKIPWKLDADEQKELIKSLEQKREIEQALAANWRSDAATSVEIDESWVEDAETSVDVGIPDLPDPEEPQPKSWWSKLFSR